LRFVAKKIFIIYIYFFGLKRKIHLGFLRNPHEYGIFAIIKALTIGNLNKITLN